MTLDIYYRLKFPPYTRKAWFYILLVLFLSITTNILNVDYVLECTNHGTYPRPNMAIGCFTHATDNNQLYSFQGNFSLHNNQYLVDLRSSNHWSCECKHLSEIINSSRLERLLRDFLWLYQTADIFKFLHQTADQNNSVIHADNPNSIKSRIKIIDGANQTKTMLQNIHLQSPPQPLPLAEYALLFPLLPIWGLSVY